MKLDKLDGPRHEFLTARSTLDVSACPGSGKTTLVVAKLAILAQKWPHRMRGICVLSHTNVAREEIQRRLGRSVVGQRLLGYPHFIDTIHGFVNRFLALPWLHSNGFPSPTIDNEMTAAYRRRTLKAADYWIVQKFLEQKYSSFDRLRLCNRDLSFDLGGKAFPANQGTRSYTLAKEAVETAAQAGYFCYDEMFVWARALLEDFPAVASWLRRRFPLVIIDEMQDTFEAQGAILHTVFPRSSPDIIVQRVGDPNQALFDDADLNASRKDPFPDSAPARCLDIPNSLRFGSNIAALASPFAVMRVGANGLCGVGPKSISGTTSEGPCAVFIFPDNSTAGVLDTYGKHVLTNFDDSALAYGTVAAVGAVHHDASDVLPGHAHFPKSVPHYWSGYTAEISRKESHPKTLVQYFRSAQAAVRDGGDLSPGVEKIAAGLIRLASRVGDPGQIKRRTRMHRAITDSLATDTEAVTVYRRLLKAILIHWTPLTKLSWGSMQKDILSIACLLCDGATDQSKAVSFLEWPGDDPSLGVCSPASSIDAVPNVYRVVDGGRCVDIRLGSIHSVKGQTHLATLVLSTYWKAHSSRRMLPWLLGAKVSDCGAGIEDRKRLVQTYVAMTRPSHMICFAAPRSTFGDEQAFSKHLAILVARGWRVAEIINGGSRWHA
ncbi:MAG TPA: UvrD-helicase domain-containing protein [Thermoanaerobaculia bacterium]|nr:UvrD-helicase domain-containing protein [Thermoanaerobaculia bacterium]